MIILDFKLHDFEILVKTKRKKMKFIISIIERIEAFKRSEITKTRDESTKKSTLHSFFKGNSELVKKIKSKE